MSATSSSTSRSVRRGPTRRGSCVAIVITLAALAACEDSARQTASVPDVVVGTAAADAFYATPFPRTPSVAALTALGRELFFDPALSASGKLSSASCHDP
jgi:cytochrome c peroxidase